MKLILMLIPVAIAAQTAVAQKKPGCTNPSLSWKIYQSYVDPVTQITYTSAIQGDSSSVYVDGSSGVQATLFLCDLQTLDAVLTISSPRSTSISFSNILVTNGNTPSWAAAGATATGPLAMDVRALGFVPSGLTRSQEFRFTTRFRTGVPEGGSFPLVLLNPSPSAPSTDGSGSVSNPPNATYYDSLINVQHCPANDALPVSALCSSGAPETWIVWPDSTMTPAQVATLMDQTKPIKPPGVNAGQFSIPFYFVISVL